jgi:hypothetical protein
MAAGGAPLPRPGGVGIARMWPLIGVFGHYLASLRATSDLHPLIRARLPASAIAARLATTSDHVLLAATRNPAPPRNKKGQRGRDPA